LWSYYSYRIEARKRKENELENVIALILAAVVLCGILFAAKKFLKPVKGKLPDCCSGEGNKNIQV
jgi:hypothetical protein